VHLPYPFDGDQALFTIGAQKVRNGALLYRDFWDLKQPGIYVFYLLAGTLFNFSEVGIHTFELLYMIAFSVVLIITLKSYYVNPAIASLVPLLTVGAYYGASGSKHLTQVEGLVGVPMFLSLWFALGYCRPKGRWALLQLFLSGLTGGLVLLFKFLFLPILMSFWLTVLVYAVVRKHEQIPSALVRISVPVASGVLFPLLIFFGYFAWLDTLSLLHYTFFECPARVMAEVPMSFNQIGRLVKGLLWFLGGFAPLTTLAFISVWASLNRRLELLTVNLVLWLVLGFGVILMQRVAWWEYHYLLLFVPLGILATKGLDILWEQAKKIDPSLLSGRRRIAAVLSVALLFSPIFASIGLKSLVLARDGFALKKEQQLKYQSRVSDSYREALVEVAFLSEPESLSGNIYICGNPVYYFLSGRDQAIALNGWSLELLLSEQWTQLTRQLTEALPSYIFVATDYLELVNNRTPETARFIEANYRVLRKSDAGIWYVLQEKLRVHLQPQRTLYPLEERPHHVWAGAFTDAVSSNSNDLLRLPRINMEVVF